MTNEFMQLHYCDEELPPRNEWVVIVVVELDHGQSTSSPLQIDIDTGYLMEDGNWSWATRNDWEEGQPWAVVAWERLPSESEIRKHVIQWKNEPKSK